MSIEANELRLGNLVKHTEDDVTGQILEFHGNEIVVEDWGFGTTNLSECESIPLSEEWLFKFGFYDAAHLIFKPIGEGYSICYNKHKHTLFVSTPKGEGFSCFENATVHQLQNLYFALTGQELTINN